MRKTLAMLAANGFGMMQESRVHNADYTRHGELCKSVVLREIVADVLIDDHPGYLTEGCPVRLHLCPDLHKPHDAPGWEKGRIRGAVLYRDPAQVCSLQPSMADLFSGGILQALLREFVANDNYRFDWMRHSVNGLKSLFFRGIRLFLGGIGRRVGDNNPLVIDEAFLHLIYETSYKPPLAKSPRCH